MPITYFPIIVAIFSFAFCWFLSAQIKRTSPSSMQGTTLWYARMHWRSVATAVVATIVCFLFLNGSTNFGFVVGAALAFLLDFLANHIFQKSVNASPDIAKRGISKAFDMLFKNGLAIALLGITFAIVGIGGYYLTYPSLAGCLGVVAAASLLALFLGVTKSPLFKAALAFQTYSAVLVATMWLGQWLYPSSPQFMLLPLALASASLLVMVVASFFAVTGKTVAGAFYKFVVANIILSAASFYFVIVALMQNTAVSTLRIFFAACIGFIVLPLLMLGAKYSRTKIERIILPLLLPAAAIAATYFLADIYGVAILALGVLSATAATFGFGEFHQIVAGLEQKFPAENADEQKKTANALESAKQNTGLTIFLYEVIVSDLAAVATFLALFAEISSQNSLSLPKQYPYIIGGSVVGILAVYLFTRLAKTATEKQNPKNISLAIIIPVAIILIAGYFLGPIALLAMLAVAIVIGMLLASIESANPALNSLIVTLPVAALVIISFLI